MLTIDGAYGEGGGQILRTTLSLSAIFKRPVNIINIRANRPKPGLRPQHLTCVYAMKTITRADVRGAEIGSQSLFFSPRGIYPGRYTFDVAERQASAGSISLIFQTLLPVLCIADKPSYLTLKGGTHVPFSPSFHYIEKVFLPMVKGIGAVADISLKRWGFYPIGKGEVEAIIYPRDKFVSKRWEKAPSIKIKGISASSNLPHVKERQRKRLEEDFKKMGIFAEIEEIEAHALGKGSFAFLFIDSEIKAGFSALGARGKPSEAVADEAFSEFMAYCKEKMALDRYLADQVLLYLALAEGSSSFTTCRVSSHLLTNLWVIRQFLDREIICEGEINKPGKVNII